MPVKTWQTPKVVFQPQALLGMQRGINRLANTIRPTLGPLPRVVAFESTLSRAHPPELLDSGGLIARRMVQLPDRDEDAGAMLLRHMLWQMHEKAGDGTATVAVLFQSVYNQGIKYIAAGGDTLRLRGWLEEGSQLIINELERMKTFLRGEEQIARLAETLCYDRELARMFGEIFASIGEYGLLDIRAGRSTVLERAYFKGAYWQGGLVARHLTSDPQKGSARLENAAILLSDLEIEDPGALIPLLDMAILGRLNQLLIVVKTITERALSLLLSPPVREKLKILVVKTPGLTADEQWAALEDLSVLTGGRPLLQSAGESLCSLRDDDWGHAAQVYTDLEQFGIIGSSCQPERLKQHIEGLKKSCSLAENTQARRKIIERIGKLLGGSAVLWIGDTTPLAIAARKALAERTSEAIRGAIHGGVVPGGGAAYLDCCPAIEAKLSLALSDEEKIAYRILIRALHEPARSLIANAGIQPGGILGQVEQAGRGYGYDLTGRQVANMIETGVYDSASVAKAAVSCAVRGAALALSTDVLVHRRNPPDGAIST